MTTMTRYPTAEELARSLGGRRNAKGWMAKCPAHEDRHASLSINDGGDVPDVEALKAATRNHRSSVADDHDHMMMRSPRMDLPAPGHHQEGDAKDDAKKALDP